MKPFQPPPGTQAPGGIGAPIGGVAGGATAGFGVGPRPTGFNAPPQGG
jgi:hypothetical protein